MATFLNKSEELKKQLKDENKVVVMNTDADMLVITNINKHMQEVKRSYEIKERKSQLSAASIVLTS